MGTPFWINQYLNQTLVYWGNPQDDGTGGLTFDDPVEIEGRCEYKVEQVVTGLGELTVSRATIYLKQKVIEGSYLYLGTLSDSCIGDDLTPYSTEGTMRVLAFEQISGLTGTDVLYKVYANIK